MGQYQIGPGGVLFGNATRRQGSVEPVMQLESDAELLEIIPALSESRCFTGVLESGQQQGS